MRVNIWVPIGILLVIFWILWKKIGFAGMDWRHYFAFGLLALLAAALPFIGTLILVPVLLVLVLQVWGKKG